MDRGGPSGTGCLLICHGTRSPAGVAEAHQFVAAFSAARPEVAVGAGFLELAAPDLDTAIDQLIGRGVTHLVAVPLILLGASHATLDGPAALAHGRTRHPGVTFTYAAAVGGAAAVLDVVVDRVDRAAASFGGGPDAVVVVGRGSSDPEVTDRFARVVEQLAHGRDGRPPLGTVIAAHASLARPTVPGALTRLHHQGERRIVVLPYLLFHGLMVEHIAGESELWAADHPDAAVAVAKHLGVDPRLVAAVWHHVDDACRRAGAPR